jgi:hypothetical protein
MTALQIYRDDGPIAAWLGRAIGFGVQLDEAPLARLVPPLVRGVEYSFLIALTAFAQPDAMPLCFAFLAVLAFHHYDTAERLRHQRLAPPLWVQAVGGGWDGRLLFASLLALLGLLGPGLLAAAVTLAVVFVSESVSSWLRFGRGGRPALYMDTGDQDVIE